MTAKKYTKERDARAKLLFCQSKPIAFLPFSFTSPSSLLKLPTNFYLLRACGGKKGIRFGSKELNTKLFAQEGRRDVFFLCQGMQEKVMKQRIVKSPS